MSAVDQGLVREYFEMHGFLVHQHRKYVVQTREKTAEEEIDLIVFNPDAKPDTSPVNFELTSRDLRCVRRAIVVVKGWHTETFTPGVLKKPRLFRFVDKDTVSQAEKAMGADGPLLKLLIVPALPATESLKQQSIALLKSKGIDGVLSFRAILLGVIERIETNRNYQKSDLLQTIRLLKNYDLIKDPQLEFFGGKRRRAKKDKG